MNLSNPMNIGSSFIFIYFHLMFFIHDTPSAKNIYKNKITMMNVYLITLFFQEVMFQGVFDVLLAQK